MRVKKIPDEYWTLFRIVHERTTPYFKRAIRPGLLNPLFGLPDSEEARTAPEPSANELYWLNWFREFSEINASVERLRQASVYLSYYPGAKAFPFQRLSEAEWVRYHVEAYIQEIYILEKRLSRFLKKAERVALRSGDKAGLVTARALKRAVEDGMKNAVRTRSSHVHERRFRDEELSNLDLALLFARAPGRKLPVFGLVRELRYHDARQKWRRIMRTNDKEIISICAEVFKESTAILMWNEPRLTRS